MGTLPFGVDRRTRGALAVGMLALASAAACRAADPVPDVANPDLFRCVGRNHFSGKADVPVEKHDDDSTWPYAVFFIDPVQGTSLIVYGPRFRQVGALMQAFIRRHECQHANGVRDEITANCNALVQMRAQGLTAQQEAQLERWHVSKGPLDPQYGGSGARFWEQSVLCAARMR